MSRALASTERSKAAGIDTTWAELLLGRMHARLDGFFATSALEHRMRAQADLRLYLERRDRHV